MLDQQIKRKRYRKKEKNRKKRNKEMSKLADIQNNDQTEKNENRKISLDKKETSKAGIKYCRGH